MSLGNAIAFEVTEEELHQTPSRRDGIDELTEFDLRVYGCELIQQACILLGLEQVVAATAQVFLQRFYFRTSLKKHDIWEIAMGAVFLATKSEEHTRRLKEVVNVFVYLRQVREGQPSNPLSLAGTEFWQLKDLLVAKEAWILRELGFHLDVEHPHKFLLNYLSMLRPGRELSDADRVMAQISWAIANDSMRTPLIVRYHVEVIATASIYLAARQCNYPLADATRWWEVFGVNLQDIEDVSRWLLFLWQRPKARYIPLTAPTKPPAAATSPVIEPSPRPQRRESRSPSRERRDKSDERRRRSRTPERDRGSHRRYRDERRRSRSPPRRSPRGRRDRSTTPERRRDHHRR